VILDRGWAPRLTEMQNFEKRKFNRNGRRNIAPVARVES